MFPMVAGSDTAAKAIKWTMHYVLSDLSVYGSLVKEIEDAVLEERISDPITYQEAQELPYLQVS